MRGPSTLTCEDYLRPRRPKRNPLASLTLISVALLSSGVQSESIWGDRLSNVADGCMCHKPETHSSLFLHVESPLIPISRRYYTSGIRRLKGKCSRMVGARRDMIIPIKTMTAQDSSKSLPCLLCTKLPSLDPLSYISCLIHLIRDKPRRQNMMQAPNVFALI